jgi:hypothetical protein
MTRPNTARGHSITPTHPIREVALITYYQRKRQASKSHREALRCLRRRLADVVYRTLRRDAPISVHGHPLTKRGIPQPWYPVFATGSVRC